MSASWSLGVYNFSHVGLHQRRAHRPHITPTLVLFYRLWPGRTLSWKENDGRIVQSWEGANILDFLEGLYVIPLQSIAINAELQYIRTVSIVTILEEKYGKKRLRFCRSKIWVSHPPRSSTTCVAGILGQRHKVQNSSSRELSPLSCITHRHSRRRNSFPSHDSGGNDKRRKQNNPIERRRVLRKAGLMEGKHWSWAEGRIMSSKGLHQDLGRHFMNVESKTLVAFRNKVGCCKDDSEEQ